MNGEKEFDCYKCEYRGSVAGSAHICCEHPKNKEHEIPPLTLLGVIMSGGKALPMYPKGNPLNIRGNPQGIAGGWFAYPLNFDPTWLENCDGFKESER